MRVFDKKIIENPFKKDVILSANVLDTFLDNFKYLKNKTGGYL